MLVAAIYADLGLNPFQAGIMSAVRQLTAGATSIGSGVLVDLFRHRSEQVLAGSMMLMGFGFFLVSIAPVYGLILAALFIASMGNALWHPPALALLSQRFPKQRGLYISLHRASGSIGDLVGPLLAGALLGFVSWRWIIGGGTPLAVAMGLLVLVLLWKVAGSQPAVVSVRSNLRNQIASMRLAFHGTGMWAIFVVSAVRGMGDRSYIFFLPLYLKEGVGPKLHDCSNPRSFGVRAGHYIRATVRRFIRPHWAPPDHSRPYGNIGPSLRDDGDERRRHLDDGVGGPVWVIPLFGQFTDAGGGHR